MDVKFKYNIGQEVITRFGSKGFIDMCAVDNGKDICYYVKTAKKNDWFREPDITEVNNV